METQSTPRLGRRALFAAGLGGAALAVAQALGAPARSLAANGASMLIARINTGSLATQVKVPNDPAMKCWSDGHDGLWASSKAAGRSGLYGFNSHAKGFAVTGRNTFNGGVGILGGPDAALKGTAAAGNLALDVEGRAHFSRSGLLVMQPGQHYAAVDGVVLSPSSTVLVTLQDNQTYDPRWVTCAFARPSESRIYVYLNDAVPSGTTLPFAWMVLD
jgi:hypothetical protein